MMINSHTNIMGLIGNPLGHSLSPIMHNMTILELGLNYVYIPFEVEKKYLHTAISGIRALNIKGVNVTLPYKESVLAYLDDITESVLQCGAANLILNNNGKLIGHNTDGKGFILSLRDNNIAVEGNIVVIGAGGAARSICFELAKLVERIDLLDIDLEKAQELKNDILVKTNCKAFTHLISEEVFLELSKNAEIIINCSPIGMYPEFNKTPILSFDNISKDAVICDLIYNPIETTFLKTAKNKGLKTINGLPMFVYQGALSFELITGHKPPINVMKEVVENELK